MAERAASGKEAQTSEHGAAENGYGTQVPVPQQRQFLGIQQGHFYSGSEICTKEYFFAMSVCWWVNVTAAISLFLLLKKIEAFEEKIAHFCSVSTDG